jgi:hypothetical protein
MMTIILKEIMTTKLRFRALFLISIFTLASLTGNAAKILINMDETQKNHMKAYGIAYWVLENEIEVEWLLNYKGGSFLIDQYKAIEEECVIRGVSYQVIADVQANAILREIADPEANMEVV